VRPTTWIGLLGLVVVGVIVADAVMHPEGVKAAGNAAVALVTPTYGALLGQVPKGYQKAG
jgi:hypothetical protein